MTKRPPISSVADAWSDWMQDFAENPRNPPIGSWMALKETFYGAILATLHLIGHDGPQEISTIRERVFRLEAEIAEWVNREEVDIQEWLGGTEQKNIDELHDWLWAQGQDDPEFGMAIWELMKTNEDGARELPEMGFAPQLMLAMAALKAISKATFPRAEQGNGEPKFPLATDMSALAATALLTIHHRRSDGGGD